jgi:CubicO group peptidase (beta-lactamase class C family)
VAFPRNASIASLSFFQVDVDKGAVPGVVVVVARDGKIVFQHALGFQDREKNIPMKLDSIFRIYSMTKPVTAVAVMMLAEEGKIDLLAPLSQYLPEFKDVKVGVDKIDPSSGKPVLVLEPAKRPVTVQDLLSHTSGIVYSFTGNSLVHKKYRTVNLYNSRSSEEFVAKLAKLPLAHQPGTTWEYSWSFTVLSRMVEVVSGLPYDRFVEERITKPLGMLDTAFYLDAAQQTRMAEPSLDPETGITDPFYEKPEDLTPEKRVWFSGGGGLLATAVDYARFCQMLLNGGELDGVRLLSPKTIAVMTSDQLLPDVQRVAFTSDFYDQAPLRELGQSFGLGFAIRVDAGRNPISGSVGDYGWSGAAGTYFWIDPQEKLFAILMDHGHLSQVNPYRRILRGLVYGALIH